MLCCYLQRLYVLNFISFIVLGMDSDILQTRVGQYILTFYKSVSRQLYYRLYIYECGGFNNI